MAATASRQLAIEFAAALGAATRFGLHDELGAWTNAHDDFSLYDMGGHMSPPLRQSFHKLHSIAGFRHCDNPHWL